MRSLKLRDFFAPLRATFSLDGAELTLFEGIGVAAGGPEVGTFKLAGAGLASAYEGKLGI